MTSITLRRTPLFDALVKVGGRMVDFHGWEMPVQFSGIVAEHKAVRNACGVFDVSHMGQVFVTGPDAHRFVQYVNSNNIKCEPGKGVYSHILADNGGIIDDAISFCIEPERFLIVVNAATLAKDFAWFEKQSAGFNVKLENASDRFGMVAVQGPKAPALAGEIFPAALRLPRFGILETEFGGEYTVVTRTGYTGEDGFEVAASPKGINAFFDELLRRGGAYGLLPCGLGSRDTLRLEAGYLLYGSDADEDHTSYEAGCGWVVKPKKGEFIGRDAVLRRKDAGLREKLTGFRLTGRGVPRHGCAVYKDGVRIGALNSATFSPSLNAGIGVGYVTPVNLEPGDKVEIEIHGARVAAEVAKTPFYDNKV
ncbi:MAG: glycine cleavage system aminomethyltransferase GcvT [Elusimicrobiaceae bacterium]|nr:glycine cleavage system aminomethyltransferase GcvT [Elusimicrobiaceae bacterium]